jgi:hypothetical protein
MLFDILYENMSKIVPADQTYEAERDEWLDAVAPALEKAPRQILLMYDDEMLAGYLQYYVNNGVFMVEEIQLKLVYQRTRLLYELCRFLTDVIPSDTQYIEAFVHEKNVTSQKLQRSLGMAHVDTKGNGTLHFRGNCQKLFKRFQKP